MAGKISQVNCHFEIQKSRGKPGSVIIERGTRKFDDGEGGACRVYALKDQPASAKVSIGQRRKKRKRMVTSSAHLYRKGERKKLRRSLTVGKKHPSEQKGPFAGSKKIVNSTGLPTPNKNGDKGKKHQFHLNTGHVFGVTRKSARPNHETGNLKDSRRKRGPDGKGGRKTISGSKSHAVAVCANLPRN